MKALKSDLAKRMLSAGVRIPHKDGAVVEFEGKLYTVQKVPKADRW